MDLHIHWIKSYGYLGLFGSQMHLTAFTAGASRLEYRHFAPYAYTGGFCWVATFLAIGYFVGEERHWLVPQIRTYLWIVLGLLAVLSLAAYLVRRLRRR